MNSRSVLNHLNFGTGCVTGKSRVFIRIRVRDWDITPEVTSITPPGNSRRKRSTRKPKVQDKEWKKINTEVKIHVKVVLPSFIWKCSLQQHSHRSSQASTFPQVHLCQLEEKHFVPGCWPMAADKMLGESTPTQTLEILGKQYYKDTGRHSCWRDFRS